MSKDLDEFEYLLPDGKLEKLTSKKGSADENGIVWDPECTTNYCVREYGEYYNYDEVFSTDMAFDDIFRNKICLYGDINAAMNKEDKKIIAFAYSEIEQDNVDDCVAFFAAEDIKGTVVHKGDCVFVNRGLPEFDSPEIFVVKTKNGFSLKLLDSAHKRRVYGYVYDVKAKYKGTSYNVRDKG